MADVNDQDIFNPSQVRALFDEMYERYGVVNLLASFGFTLIWRKICVSKIKKRKIDLAIDLMTGMGESLPDLEDHLPGIQQIKGIDFSKQMCARAINQKRRLRTQTEIIEADVFDNSLKDCCADVVISTFGLKTFSRSQQSELAKQTMRLLKPGGDFSFIEISIPSNFLLKLCYGLYVKKIIPWIGKLCMGNPDNYRFLGVYSEKYGNSRHFFEELKKCGLQANYFEHFFGCASGVYGEKPP